MPPSRRRWISFGWDRWLTAEWVWALTRARHSRQAGNVVQPSARKIGRHAQSPRRSKPAAAVRVGSGPGELRVRVVRGTRHARDEDAHEEGGRAPDIGRARGEWCLGVR